MMKLAYPILSKPIEIPDNKTAVLVIENQMLYAKVLFELISQLNGNEGEFVLSRNDAIINIAKEAELVIDPFMMDINQRKVITRLHQMLNTLAMNEDNYQKTMRLSSEMQQYIEDIVTTTDYELEYNQTIDAAMIFKITDVKIAVSSERLAEKIIDYITVMTDLFKTACFIFVNLKSFINDEDMANLYKHFAYKKICVLLIENITRDTKYEHEIIRIIDHDMCEIY
ncbi:MAG: type II-A CRISPR-associated protein Csn2 [bacterium]